MPLTEKKAAKSCEKKFLWDFPGSLNEYCKYAYWITKKKKGCINLGAQFNLLVQLGALYMCQKYYSSSQLQLRNDLDSDRWITLVGSPARPDVPCQINT